MFRYWFLTPALGGLFVLIIAHAAFAARLRKAHPELWGRFRNLFWSFPDYSRTKALKNDDYSRLDDKFARYLLEFQRFCWIAYAMGLLIAVRGCSLSTV